MFGCFIDLPEKGDESVEQDTTTDDQNAVANLIGILQLAEQINTNDETINVTHIAASATTALSSHTCFNFFSWYNLLLTNKKIGV